jgi:hypothetical protein
MHTASHFHLYLSINSLSVGGSILPVLAIKLETYFDSYINSSIYDLEDFNKIYFRLKPVFLKQASQKKIIVVPCTKGFSECLLFTYSSIQYTYS